MRIDNAFVVQAPPEAAWSLLSDVPRIVPCMPGAELERTVGKTSWQVLLRVKLGPISLQFRCAVEQTELDPAERRAVLSVDAKEVRGRGGAQATIESRLQPAGVGTDVAVATEVALRGVVAQYGRAVVNSVAEEMTRQFATCLASMLEREEPAPQPSVVRPVGGLRVLFSSLRRRLLRRG